MFEYELKNAYIGEYDFAKYQQVEYIQTSWGQCIDTWVILWSNNFRAEEDLEITERSGREAPLFSIWTSTYNYWNLFLRATQHDFDFYANWHNINYTVPSLNTKYNAYIERSGSTWNCGIGSITKSVSYTPWQVNNTTLKLLNRWDIPWTTSADTRAKLYSCKVTVGWTLVRNFIPCYRKSDTVVWLYDLVNNQFYTNSWTWTFTKWPDVS